MTVQLPLHPAGSQAGPIARLALALLVAAPLAGAQYHFSHDEITLGQPGSAVFAAPDIRDVFETNVPVGDLVTLDTNTLKVNNPASWGLLADDNVDALCDDGTEPAAPFNGVYNPNFVFSVEPGANGELGTPINLEVPFNAADVFNFLGPPNGHGLVNFENQMDLDPTNVVESIDGIHVFENSNEFDPGARVHFSLEAGSPTLAANGWSAADVLTTVVGSGVVQVAIEAEELGLAPGDDLDGLVMFGVWDQNGNGDLSDLADVFQVWFSVDTGSVGLAGTDVRENSTGNGVHGDVYFSQGAGDNARLYDAILWTRLLPGDVVDALDIDGDLISPAPPPPGLIPPPPVLPPPMRPFCGGWIGICNGQQPKDIGAQLLLTLVDDNGVFHKLPLKERKYKANPNSPDPACDKAVLMATFLSGITVTINGQEMALFDDSSIFIDDPVHFPGVAQVEKEVCLRLSPQFSATGWSIANFGLSMDNWTAGFLSEDYNWQTPLFRMYRLSMDTIPTAPGLFRAVFGDSFGNTQVFSTPFGAGENPTAVMQRMIDEINNAGGEACFDFPDPLGQFPTKQSIVVARVPLEPPVQGNQFGPYLEEFGANGNDVTVSVKFEARTARVVCPQPPAPVPTLSEWGLILMTLLIVTLGAAFLARSSRPAVAGAGGDIASAGTRPLWDARVYRRCLLALAGLATLGAWVAVQLTGPLAAVDIAGLAVTVPLAAWTLQLLIGSRR